MTNVPQPEGEPQLRFRIEVPPGMENGVYSNLCSVWHGPHDFTLDFAVTAQAEQEPGEVVVPARVAARIKIPLTMAQDLLRALATQVSKFEEAAGPIRKPGDDRPMFPPEDMK